MSYGQSRFCLSHHLGAHHPIVCQPASFCERRMERETELDLIEKYRICLQSLIIGKYDMKDDKTNHKWSSIIKYLYNARNITIQPIQTDLH